MKMKNDIKKAQDFFKRFTKEEIRKIKILTDIVYGKIEVNFGPGAILNEELENIDPARKKMLFITPNEIKYKGMYIDEAERLLQSISNEFGFGSTFFEDGLDHYFFYVNDRANFYYFYEQLSKFIDDTVGGNIENYAKVYYQKAGIGTVNGFNFKLHTKEKRRVFEELYLRIGEPIPRQRVLKLIGFYDEDEMPNTAYGTNETYKINKFVKELRDDTGLTPRQLVNNNGDLTFIGKKAEPTG